MSRGGRFPGAGVPQGNLNALKNGQYSRQLHTAFDGSQQEWNELLARIKDEQMQTRVKASMVLRWIRLSYGNKTG